MLVIHPKDKSTSLAEAIYANMPNVHVVEANGMNVALDNYSGKRPKKNPY